MKADDYVPAGCNLCWRVDGATLVRVWRIGITEDGSGYVCRAPGGDGPRFIVPVSRIVTDIAILGIHGAPTAGEARALATIAPDSLAAAKAALAK